MVFNLKTINKRSPYQVFPVSVLTLHHHAENIGTQLNVFAVLHADSRHANFDVMSLSLSLYLHLHDCWARTSKLLDLVFSQSESQSSMINIKHTVFIDRRIGKN